MQAVLKFQTRPVPEPVIRVRGLGKVYAGGVRALDSMDLDVGAEEFIAVIGCSGAGKSTFLRCLNQLVTPTEGEIALMGEPVSACCGRSLRQVRRRMGMIFQQFHLVRRLTVLENVLVGRLRFNGTPLRHLMSAVRKFPASEREIAFDCLRQVGIAELAFQRADTLSGGQQQRVAIARALAQEPEVFLADEPIASLDPRSARSVMDTLRRIQEEKKIPVIVILHQISVAREYAHRIVGMRQGKKIFDGTVETLSEEVISNIYGHMPQEPSPETDPECAYA